MLCERSIDFAPWARREKEKAQMQDLYLSKGLVFSLFLSRGVGRYAANKIDEP